VRTAYKCRAYPDQLQRAMLSRTFGCVRVVWNRTLAARQARWRSEGKGTSYAETDRALTAMKRDPDLEFLNEVPAVPLQQALRHQQAAFTAFWESVPGIRGSNPGPPGSRPATPGRPSE
jgi:putative transposase